MILIVCENFRTSKNVALALGADLEPSKGIYTSNTLTVATVPADFIRHTPLAAEADGTLPFIPEKFKMSVTDKTLERELKPLFREAAEVVFASAGGADVQARFFNICRHFRVGCTTSRMWVTRLSYGAIRGAFHYRESGRHLYRLAQTGLVSKGMDMLFEYNFGQAMSRVGLPDYKLSRHEVITLENIGNVGFASGNQEQSGHTIFINANSGDTFEAQTVWEDEKDAEKVLQALKPGTAIPAEMTVTETTAYNLRFHTLHTLQMDAFNNLGFSPAKTLKVAKTLYGKGLISSPLTANSHLPEQLQGHLETVFGVTGGYQWGDNGTSLNDHAIITLRAAEEGMAMAEIQLYRLIFNRMKAVLEQPPTRKYATIDFQVGGVHFTREWELTGEAYHATEPGMFATSVMVEDAAVYPCDMPKVADSSLTDTLWMLTKHTHEIEANENARIPFTQSLHDYGSVISSLVAKGLVSIDGKEVGLTPEGWYIYDELAGREFSQTLITWQLEANRLSDGCMTGRDVMAGFSNSLLRIIELIDPQLRA